MQYSSKSEKEEKKKRRELETETGGMVDTGGSGEQKPKKRGGKANRSEQQLRGKEGTTCFAVSLTPAVIHRERNHSVG